MLTVRLRDVFCVALLVMFALFCYVVPHKHLPECANPLLLYTACAARAGIQLAPCQLGQDTETCKAESRVGRHKTGTILAKDFAAAVNVQLRRSCQAVIQVDYNCPPDIGAPPAKLLLGRKRRLDDEGRTPCIMRPRGCVALIARDPRELVVSGFLYHRRGAPDNRYDRTWLNAAMWSDEAAARSIPPPTVLPWPHVRFATLVSESARPHGQLHGVLPQPLSPSESYVEYLRRIPERLGLAAEASAALRLSVPATELVLAQVHRRKQRGDCADVVCLGELQAGLPACEAGLAKLLALTEPSRATDLAAVAARTACPASTIGGHSARQHSSGAAHSERVRLLRLVDEIDATLLNGSLAASARRLRCTSAELEVLLA